MTNAKKLALAAILAVATVVAACTDRRPDNGMPTAPRMVPGARANTMGTCTTMSALDSLAYLVFGTGSPNVNSVLGKLSNLQKKVEDGNVADAQAQAMNIVQFVRDKAAEGQLAGTQAQITQFISGVLCYAGLSPDTFLILPSDDPQIRTSSDGVSGVSLQGNTVTEPALLTLTTLADTGPPPLDTKLDKYPSYISITISSALTKPAIVSVCPKGDIPSDVLARLRLGHQAATGFEITPTADGTFLQCGLAASLASKSRVPAWLRNVASIFIPKPLYAKLVREEADRGVGGLATEFSPFGTVDPELDARGVGGLATEFKKTPAERQGFGKASAPAGGSGPAMSSSSPGVALAPGGLASLDDPCAAATVGTAVDTSCRPVIILTTPNGTPFESVPVAWAVESGGGTIAPDTLSSQTCGAFGAAAPTTTDVLGKAGICWTLGPNGGTNTVTAVPSVGGDAPAGVIFKPARLRFTMEGLKITPTATATGGTFVYDTLSHSGSGTCSNDLTPALTYSNGAPPVAKGSYVLTVTCGAGSTVYNTVTDTATIIISAAVPTVAVSCPASVVYTGAAQTPCSATITAPGLSLTPTPTYSNNTNVGTATASVSVDSGGNYAAASGSATFQITPAATTTSVVCPVSPVTYTGSPITPCTAAVAGAGGLNAPLSVSYSANVNAGTATASAAYAGDANHSGSNGSANFTIGPAASATTVTCPAAVTYTGAPLTPCSASASGAGGLSLSLTPSYSSNVSAGTATASASYPGDANHTASSGSTNFTIGTAASLTTVSCPVSVLYTGAAQTPCSAAVTGVGGLNQAVTPVTYTSNIVGTATATATYAGGANWSGSLGSSTFMILYVQSGCFASPIYNAMPDTKSYQRKGSNLPVKCTLKTASGAGVLNAHGDLLVEDKGATPTGPTSPTIGSLSLADIFKVSGSGNYSYGMDTSPAFFVVGHFYYVTAKWTDGSRTTGWFYVK